MELALHIDQMESQLELMETRLTTLDDKLSATNEMVTSTNDMVKEMHTIVIGTEHTRNDSLLAKVNSLKEELEDQKKELQNLKDDKLKRDTNLKTYLGIASLVGAAIWTLLSGALKFAITVLTKH